MHGQRLVNHVSIRDVHDNVNNHIIALENLQQKMFNMGEAALAGWQGQSAEAFSIVNKENYKFFGALITGLRSLNDGLSQANQDFQTMDNAVASRMEAAN